MRERTRRRVVDEMVRWWWWECEERSRDRCRSLWWDVEGWAILTLLQFVSVWGSTCRCETYLTDELGDREVAGFLWGRRIDVVEEGKGVSGVRDVIFGRFFA